MSWYGDPDGLHRLAAQLSAAAGRARDRACDVRATSSSAQWHGAAADAFHASVFRECGVLERAADELDDAARALHRHADAVRHELDRLLAAERAAEHLLSAGVSRVVGLVS
ncbi:MAG: hypothetical protein QOE05_446 [Actinomycetota bacterium]|jgi:uncharacterized protein YukE|nr:hypothetical protein [Actinomycetota bacterium]